jgi:hypothetical protein
MYPISFSRAKLVGSGVTTPVKKNLLMRLNDKYHKLFSIMYVRNRSTFCSDRSTVLSVKEYWVSTPCSWVLTGISPISAPTYTSYLVLITSVSSLPIFRHPEVGGITFLRNIVANVQSQKDIRWTSPIQPRKRIFTRQRISALPKWFRVIKSRRVT